MTILKGKAMFKCPRTGEEVTLHKDCIDCSFFKHWSWESTRPILACAIDEYAQYKKDREDQEVEKRPA